MGVDTQSELNTKHPVSRTLDVSPERNVYTTGVVCKGTEKGARTPSVLLVQDESVYINVRVFLYRVNVL